MPEQRAEQPWLTLTEASGALGVSTCTLRIAAEHREIHAEHPLPDGPWVFTRDALHTAAASGFLERVVLHRAGMAVPPRHATTPSVRSGTRQSLDGAAIHPRARVRTRGVP